MTLEELQKQQLGTTTKPLHMLGDGKTSLTLCTSTGRYIFVVDPVSGEVQRRELASYRDPDAHLGGVRD